MKQTSTEQRFRSRVQKTDACWFWQGGKNPNGYGMANGPRGWETAHRVAYRYAYGDFDPNLEVLHWCDVRNCVNPKHLFLGTIQDNIRDMDKKGRRHTKLTWTQVREIRKRYSLGERCSVLSREYFVGYSTVSRIIKNKGWIEEPTQAS